MDSPENDPRTAPARMSGAVSPSALESARTVPVRMPGAADGMHELARHLPARRTYAVTRLPDGVRHGAQRLDGGDDDDREDQHREGDPTGQDVASGPLVIQRVHERDEDRQAQQAVHDRRDARQVADVDLDEPGELRVGCVLLEVDRRRQAEREREDRHDCARGWPCRRVPERSRPCRGWTTAGEVRNPRPRSANTGHRPAQDVGDEDEQDRQREQQAAEEQGLEDDAPDVAPPAAGDPGPHARARDRGGGSDGGHRKPPSTAAGRGGRTRRRRRSGPA